ELGDNVDLVGGIANPVREPAQDHAVVVDHGESDLAGHVMLLRNAVVRCQTSAGLSTAASMSTRRLPSSVVSEYRPTRPSAAQIEGSTRFRRMPVLVIVMGTLILWSSRGVPVGASGPSCRVMLRCGAAFLRESLTSIQAAASRPSRWAASSRPAS